MFKKTNIATKYRTELFIVQLEIKAAHLMPVKLSNVLIIMHFSDVTLLFEEWIIFKILQFNLWFCVYEL